MEKKKEMMMSKKNSKPKKAWCFYLIILMVFAWCWTVSTAWAEEGDLVTTGEAAMGSAGKKDPFKPFVDTASDVVKQKKGKGALPLSPLQRQDLSVFNLVGITGNDKDGWRAIVEDGEKFYSIVAGTLLGRVQGRGTSIK